jgi:type IV secretion system protein VirB11
MATNAESPAPGAIYLHTYLAPLERWLADPDVTELLVNRPGELWVERVGHVAMERHLVPALDEPLLRRLALQIARQNSQGVSRETPLLAAVLPGGARVQVVLPPATRGHVALAIRKHVLKDLSLADYAAAGALANAKVSKPGELSDADHALSALLNAGDILRFLARAVAERKTILLSGGTSSGKTTLLNALLKEVPEHERIVVIEDTPEVRLDRDNALGLVAVHGVQGEARITIDDLLRASLRLRPDRLLVGELRGPEAVTFLRAINTGHPGSFATIHSSSAQSAFEQLALMCVQAGLGLRQEDALRYARQMIDIVVQLDRREGLRGVSEIAFTPGAR